MAALGTIATARQLQIGGTRRLAFAEFGDPAGTPVFLFHGLPATRLFRHPDDALTASLGIRLITIDRPGLGLSDRLPGRTLLDWPDDVNALADVLKIGSFAVLGHAVGGPYAAACAYRLPGRVTKAAIVSGFPPSGSPQSPGLAQLRLPWPPFSPKLFKAQWMLKAGLWIVWQMHHFSRDHQRFWSGLLNNCSEPDCRLFSASPELHEMMEANLEEFFQAPYIGCAEDLCTLSGAWGFRLNEIRIPVAFWWGEADLNVPFSAGQPMAAAIPRSEIRVIPEAGHYVLLSHWETVLSSLLPDFS
jgi:pimeloyl-ACP methyl ester carboxylesterase